MNRYRTRGSLRPAVLLAALAAFSAGCAGVAPNTRHVDVGSFDVTVGSANSARKPNELAPSPEQGDIEAKVIAALAKETAAAKADPKKNVHVGWKTVSTFGSYKDNPESASLDYDDAKHQLVFDPHSKQSTDVYAGVTPDKIARLAAMGPTARFAALEGMGCPHRVIAPETGNGSGGRRLRGRFRVRVK